MKIMKNEINNLQMTIKKLKLTNTLFLEEFVNFDDNVTLEDIKKANSLEDLSGRYGVYHRVGMHNQNDGPHYLNDWDCSGLNSDIKSIVKFFSEE